MRMQASGRCCGLFIALVLARGFVSSSFAGDGERKDSAKPLTPGEAVRQAVDPDERIEKLLVLRRRLLDLDFQAWQSLVEGNIEEACEAKAEELSEVKVAYGEADPWSRVIVWSAESFEPLRKLPAEQRELLHQAARADRMGQRLRSSGSLDRALLHLRRAVEGYVDLLGNGSQITVYGLHRLAELEAQTGDLESAFAHRKEMLDSILKKLDEKNPFAAWASGQMALVEEKLNRLRDAEGRWKQIVTATEPLMIDNPQPFVAILFALAHQHLAQLANGRGEFALAETHAREAVMISAAEIALSPSADTRGAVAMAEIELAVALTGLGRIAEADRAFDSVLRFMYSNPNERPPVPIQVRVLSKYAEHCHKAKRESDARKLEAKLAHLKASESAPEKSASRTAAGESKTK